MEAGQIIHISLEKKPESKNLSVKKKNVLKCLLVQLLEAIHVLPPPSTLLHRAFLVDSELHSSLLQSEQVGGFQHIRRARCTSTSKVKSRGGAGMAAASLLRRAFGKVPGRYFSIYCSTSCVIRACSKSLFKRRH